MRTDEEKSHLSAIAETISAAKAWGRPQQALRHYESLAKRLWLPPKLASMSNDMLRVVQTRQTAWGSISAPYGFGKTAATIALWAHARGEGFVAIPPLSCTNFDDLARGIAALAAIQLPKYKKNILELFSQVWLRGLEQIVAADSSKYELSPKKVKALLRDKIESGHFALDGGSHRLVEFLAQLSDFVANSAKGLVIIIDELQQMLGPLDAEAIVRFREFVWGMRTEQMPCGVILSLDSLLEARLGSWAADVLHRIHENAPGLQLAEVYDRDFPAWLWSKASTNNGTQAAVAAQAMTQEVLHSLGQLVERPDLSNGPRTVVDVFHRADEHFAETETAYSVCDLAEDVHRGRFRYFGEGAPIQRLLARLLSDYWIASDHNREKLVRTLSVFPAGCPFHVLTSHLPDLKALKAARAELFGPLLVELPGGLAFEELQHVRRAATNLEQVLARCWEQLPALSSLAPHMPEIVRRVLVPKLFGSRNGAQPLWKDIADESRVALTGWAVLRGSFDEKYPQRDLALWISQKPPEIWPDDCDLCMALICEATTDTAGRPSISIPVKDRRECVLLSLPLFKPLEGFIPGEIGRFRKYVAPEPLRPASILSAVHELEAVLGRLRADEPDWGGSETRRIRGFIDVALGFLSVELLQGPVDVGLGKPMDLRGEDLLKALFTTTCRSRYPKYQTFIRTSKFLEPLAKYTTALRRPHLNQRQRQGCEEVSMPKAEIFASLFDEPSTAAGDSLLRSFGPLVLSSGDAKRFNLQFTPHPAETALLGYLRKIRTRDSVPQNAASEFLRRLGYLQVEVQQTIQLLAAREHLGIDESGDLHLFISDSSAQNMLTEMFATLQSDARLLRIKRSELEMPTNSHELQAAITQIRESIDQCVSEIEQEIAASIDSHRDLIGSVVAASVPKSWPPSELSTHLEGISSVLRKIREDLLLGLRSDLEVATRIKESFDGIASAAQWLSVRLHLGSKREKLHNRVTQFIERVSALSAWEPLAHQLLSTRLLCDRVVDTDVGQSIALDQVTEKYRERFATDPWEPLFEASKFGRELISVQAGVQSLLFRHLENYLSQQRTLVARWGDLLGHLPPDFSLAEGENASVGAIEAAYQRLYQWALKGFQTSVLEYRKWKESGAEWRDSQKRVTWKEARAKVEVAIEQTISGKAAFDQMLYLGEKVERMASGFGDVKAKDTLPWVRKFDNPNASPDFGDLQKLFAEGKIVIQVERRGSRV
jgi:hypothetical protein